MKKIILALYGILAILPKSGFASFDSDLDRFLLENKESIETLGIEYFHAGLTAIINEKDETYYITKTLLNNTENRQHLLECLFIETDELIQKAIKIIEDTKIHIKNLKILKSLLIAGIDNNEKIIIINLNKQPEYQISLVDQDLKIDNHNIEYLYKKSSIKDSSLVIIISEEELLCFTYQSSSTQEDISNHLKKILAFSTQYQQQKPASSLASQTKNLASTPEITAVAASIEPETPYISYTSSELAVRLHQSEQTSQANALQVDIYTGTVECDSQITILSMLLEDQVPPTETFLQQIGETLNAIYHENPTQAQEEKVTAYHERIKNLFSLYMEQELDRFCNELSRAYKHTGSSHCIFQDFSETTKRFVESLSDPLRDIIADVDIALTKASHSQTQFQQLKSELKNYPLIGIEDQHNTLLYEFNHLLKMLSRNKKHIFKLSNTFLDRLSSILRQPEPVFLGQETRTHTIQMLEEIEKTLGYELVAASNTSNGDISCLDTLCDAILDTRLPSLLEENEAFELLERPPTKWVYSEFIAFLRIASEHKSFHLDFDYNFQLSVNNAIRDRNNLNKQSPLFKQFKNFLEQDIEGTLDRNTLSIEDNYIAVLAEKALGRRAINYQTARKSAHLLAATTPYLRKRIIDNFFAPEPNIINNITCSLLTNSIAKIVIKQSPRELKADIHLLNSSGDIVQAFTAPIMSSHGIPDESLATAIQLLFTTQKIEQFYTNIAGRFTLQYYRPSLMIEPSPAPQAITDGSEQKTGFWNSLINKFSRN